MDKTMLEKRIEERAEKRFNDDLRNLINVVNTNAIGTKLTLLIDGKPISLAKPSNYKGIINEKALDAEFAKHTNLKEVKEILIEQYIKEETDAILDKLTNIDYLFQNQ